MKIETINVCLLAGELVAAIEHVKGIIYHFKIGIVSYKNWTDRAKAANPNYITETKERLEIYERRLVYLKNKYIEITSGKH